VRVDGPGARLGLTTPPLAKVAEVLVFRDVVSPGMKGESPVKRGAGLQSRTESSTEPVGDERVEEEEEEDGDVGAEMEVVRWRAGEEGNNKEEENCVGSGISMV
jgi:hypothetical protein